MTDVQALLGLSKPPVAVAFLSEPPSGVEKWEDGAVPAGCFFWRKAQEGRAFYTTPSDHYNCAVGAYTHQIALPTDRAAELEQTVGFMVETEYITLEEVPSIPTLPATPAVIAYGPAGSVPFPPSVVILAAKPAQAMLLYEAALKAGAASTLMNSLGRPGCAALPLSLQTGAAALSLGCKGNRTFTGLPEDEMYLVVPGNRWDDFTEQVTRINAANQAMEVHYRQRQSQFAAS